VRIEIRPASAAGAGAGPGWPATTGAVVVDGADACFVPRHPFLAGTTYAVRVDGTETLLHRAGIDTPATAHVVGIHPTCPTVPRNLLRCYVEFDRPMSEGFAARSVRLIEANGTELVDALLPTEPELWDGARRRLTVLLDPGRIKRGLVGHRAVGYPLPTGGDVRLVIDERMRDADGRPLRAAAQRSYRVGADERRPIDPTAWTVPPPPTGTGDDLVVRFDRPLDHALLGRCLRVLDPLGAPVPGRATPGPQDRSWRLSPARPWRAGEHRLVVDPVLEDLAGNSVTRVFDRELDRPGGRTPPPASVPFLLA